MATDKSGKAHEILLLLFLAGEPDLLGVDHHDEVARITMRRVNSLFLAAQKVGGFDRHATEHLVFGVDNPPLAWYFTGFCGKRFHRAEKGTETTGQPRWCQTLLASSKEAGELLAEKVASQFTVKG